MKSKHRTQGVLLLYHHSFEDNAPTLREHVRAFQDLSGFRIWPLDVAYGFYPGLLELDFQAVILHYSLFDSVPFHLSSAYLEFLRSSRARKTVFFQDEYWYWPERRRFLKEIPIQTIYTLIDPVYWSQTYLSASPRSKILHTIPGFVTRGMIQAAARFSKTEAARSIDVGYRARKLPMLYGKGSQEKWEIGMRFKSKVPSDIKTDIEVEEAKRIYGDGWYRFLADCRAVLGVESGVSVSDLDGELRRTWDLERTAHPQSSDLEIYSKVVAPHENNLPIQTISPRHFEAAVFKVAQILYEGEYSGILKPDLHYLPLKKDFSNLDKVLAELRNPERRRAITEQAYRDLVLSGQFHEQKFIQDFDRELQQAGLNPEISESDASIVEKKLRDGHWRRKFIFIKSRNFPGKTAIKHTVQRARKLLRGGV